MTEPRGDEMRNFWSSLITADKLIALIVSLVAVGAWYQSQKDTREHLESRVTMLESRVDRRDAKDISNEVSRAEVTLKLLQISADISALRDEVKDVKNEVRKIR